MRTINEIIVHCTATPEGRRVTVDAIRQWHKARGWSDIGYHYVVYQDGSVHEGRPVERAGAHAKGHNADTIGVCYVGGLTKDGETPKDTRTGEQKAALDVLLRDLIKRFPDIALISGHHDYANRACPCFPARAEYRYLTEESEELDARPQAAPRPDVEAVLADADKPLGQSKTVWGALLAGSSSVVSSFGDLPETVSLALIAVAVGAAAFVIWDRRRKARLAHWARTAEAVL